MADTKDTKKQPSWKREAGSVLAVASPGKPKNTATPTQQRLIEALHKAQMQAERAGYFGTPDPGLLAYIAEVEKKLATLESRNNRPKRVSAKTGKVIEAEAGTVRQEVVTLPTLPPEEIQGLQELAAKLKVHRDGQTRTDIVEALRVMSVAAMPRTKKEAQKGTYHVIWPMAKDRWCRASVTGDEGRETMWGKDRVWMRVVQTWAAEALRRDPSTRKIVFPSYRSILERMGMDTGGTQIKQVAEAMQRMSNCTWRFDFATNKEDLENIVKNPNPSMGGKTLRFILVKSFNLPSRKDADRELRAGTEPLQMGEGDTDEPYFIEISEDIAVALQNPKELHIMPMLLVQEFANEPLTLDFADWCLQGAKRITSPWEVREEALLRLFGQGRGKDGKLTKEQRWSLFNELDRALARLIEALAPQFHAEFRLEKVPRPQGQRGPTQSERRLVLYPLRGPIEYLPHRKAHLATLKG